MELLGPEWDHLSGQELDDIKLRLNRFDAASGVGNWTFRTLELIREHPGVLAAELAKKCDMDKPRFKTNVRKLKNLGLTISLEVGYMLSPRGIAFMKQLGGDPRGDSSDKYQ